ncbi:alpha/beta hydrolase [Altericroceibacterium endophyticum]|uniref:Alpha/beta hydrolase fold domain-containing protein n=1 Tax=Altericroceibacterium endophyticum TaxID=1808508 RepID=A0A6I4T4D5_9SPHN|nr:alpha/beta hydrolase [Altericroceibacterium endophyticum]MXO65001.1 alpha/beta hydrolase fold domain-containing protein [Altericroceibacterium endophyticum]
MTSRHLVDPEIQPMLEMPDNALTAESLPELRANPMFSGADLPPPPYPIEEAFAPRPDGGSVRLLVMNPPSEGSLRPAILHIHGGGMVVGTADAAVPDKAPLAAALDCVVVSVDYRLAPETPFPGPQDDCFAALQWMVAQADNLGIDADRIVVLGESAGGGLAAALAQMVRDRQGPALAGQVLIYPMLDHRVGGDSDPWRNRHTGEFIWTRAKNQFGWEALRGDYQPDDARKGWFSPALAEDLSSVAPTFLATGALDLFLDEDLDYGRRLVDAGVPLEMHVYAGAIHGFQMVPDTQLADQAATDLKRGLARLMR